MCFTNLQFTDLGLYASKQVDFEGDFFGCQPRHENITTGPETCCNGVRYDLSSNLGGVTPAEHLQPRSLDIEERGPSEFKTVNS